MKGKLNVNVSVHQNHNQKNLPKEDKADRESCSLTRKSIHEINRAGKKQTNKQTNKIFCLYKVTTKSQRM